MESVLPLREEAAAFISDLGRRRIVAMTGEPRSTAFLLQRLSVAIQRGNAASVIETSPRRENLRIFLLLDLFVAFELFWSVELLISQFLWMSSMFTSVLSTCWTYFIVILFFCSRRIVEETCRSRLVTRRSVLCLDSYSSSVRTMKRFVTRRLRTNCSRSTRSTQCESPWRPSLNLTTAAFASSRKELQKSF